MIRDDIYASYINLDHRRDRDRRMRQTLAKVGIEATRTRGMCPSEYKGNPDRVKVMRDRTPGAIGCWFSQVTVMGEAKARDCHALVLEDDLVFCDDFWKRWSIIEGFLSTHPWDVFWLGATVHINPPAWHQDRDAQRTDHPRILRTFGAFSTHAYLVNRDSIGHILEELDRILPESMGIDWAFIQLQPRLYTYTFVPGCVIQYDGRSDIGRGMTTFSKFATLGPYWFANSMTDFDPTTFDWAEANGR